MASVPRRLGEGRKEDVSFGRLINNPKATPVGLAGYFFSREGREVQRDWRSFKMPGQWPSK